MSDAATVAREYIAAVGEGRWDDVMQHARHGVGMMGSSTRARANHS